ncbi:hypothetical protein [Phocaeicola plebeius]|uniref:hypothetical protein n=1 Tax=Phocaeicola plebeius TaxID=310297 RepID=UPI004024BB05
MPASLKENVKIQDIINEIRLQWNTSTYHHKVLIMVEGKDDQTFYFKFFEPYQSELKTCKGCKKLKDIYNKIKSSLSIECIAIKDSDFDRLNNVPPIDDGFFYTDCHDYEMMCLADELVKKELFDNLAIMYDADLIETTLNDLRYLSYFKWYNYTYKAYYEMKAIKVENESVENLRNYSYLHNIAHVSSSKSIIDEESLNQFIASKTPPPSYEITNGHDFIKRLCYRLKTKEGQHNINENQIRLVLHPCFRKENFQQTKLYKDIKNWERKKGRNILK